VQVTHVRLGQAGAPTSGGVLHRTVFLKRSNKLVDLDTKPIWSHRFVVVENVRRLTLASLRSTFCQENFQGGIIHGPIPFISNESYMSLAAAGQVNDCVTYKKGILEEGNAIVGVCYGSVRTIRES